MANELLKKNVHSLYLWVIEKNPAGHFYEALGAKLLDAQQKASFGDTQLIEKAYGWDNIETLIFP